jgi:hypothetical protein
MGYFSSVTKKRNTINSFKTRAANPYARHIYIYIFFFLFARKLAAKYALPCCKKNTGTFFSLNSLPLAIPI